MNFLRFVTSLAVWKTSAGVLNRKVLTWRNRLKPKPPKPAESYLLRPHGCGKLRRRGFELGQVEFPADQDDRRDGQAIIEIRRIHVTLSVCARSEFSFTPKPEGRVRRAG